MYDLERWNCKKVTIDAQLGEGRFIIKKNRGDEEGYMVLAPAIVAKDEVPSKGDKNRFNRKFIVNLGWIPKSSKHMIPKTSAYDVIGENDYTEDPVAAREINRIKGDCLNRATSFEDYYYPLCTFSAYVRPGEEENKARGRSNFKSMKLFKFIDLEFIARVFRIANHDEASTVYFERVAVRYIFKVI